MFTATLAIPLVPKMQAMLGRQKYRIHSQEPHPKRPGCVTIKAEHDPTMKGTGKAPKRFTQDDMDAAARCIKNATEPDREAEMAIEAQAFARAFLA